MATKTAGEKPKRKHTDLLIKCPRCGYTQHEYVYSLEEKRWFKCGGCKELSASGAWIVVYFGG